MAHQPAVLNMKGSRLKTLGATTPKNCTSFTVYKPYDKRSYSHTDKQCFVYGIHTNSVDSC
jgi:hypothetical protein